MLLGKCKENFSHKMNTKLLYPERPASGTPTCLFSVLELSVGNTVLVPQKHNVMRPTPRSLDPVKNGSQITSTHFAAVVIITTSEPITIQNNSTSFDDRYFDTRIFSRYSQAINFVNYVFTPTRILIIVLFSISNIVQPTII